MSRRARTRMQHPRRVAVNSVEIAINRARKLADADVNGQMAIVRHALAEFCRGIDCAMHWDNLAVTSNVAEILADMGIGSGDEADRVINTAQQALHDVRTRQVQRGTWTLYADEIDALHWLAQLHAVQLAACSYGEFSDALARLQTRQQQARAGNAPAGALVVTSAVEEQPETRA